MRRRHVLAAGAAAALVALPASAVADVTLTNVLSTPNTTIDRTTKQVIYYLQFRSGPADERFSVKMVPPKFASQGPFDEGQSVDGPRAVVLQGPGTLGAQGQDPSIMEPCSSLDSRFHGYATGASSVDVLLPANSATTLAVRYATGRRPPWVDGNYKLTFQLQPQLVGIYGEDSPFSLGPTGVVAKSLTTKGPEVSGRTGAHIILSTSPKGTTTTGAAARKVGRTTPIRVTGRVLPAVKHRTVVLEYSRNGGSLHSLARAKTDARGRFTAPAWKLGRAGTFDLWARYPIQGGGLSSDKTSCPVVFSAR